MSEATSLQQEASRVESRGEARSQVARHVAQQPASIQAAHRWLLALEAVGAILYIGLLVVAVYVSVTWKTYGELAVPRWWMASQASAALLVGILGLHTLMVGAFAPIPYPGGKETIATGRQAGRQGWMLIGLALLWAAAWGGIYLGIVLSGAEPLKTFITFVVALSIALGVSSGVWSAIRKRVTSR